MTMKTSDEHDFAVAIHNGDDDEGDVKVAVQLLMIMHDNTAVANEGKKSAGNIGLRGGGGGWEW